MDNESDDLGSKNIRSPEVEPISSNTNSLIDIGKGVKLDVQGLKNYLDSLKK